MELRRDLRRRRRAAYYASRRAAFLRTLPPPLELQNLSEIAVFSALWIQLEDALPVCASESVSCTEA
jgi:hypothetical protein